MAEALFDHEKIVTENFDQLIDKIDIKHTIFLDKMMSKGAIKAGDVAEIREYTPRKQLREVLEKVRQGDWKMFQIFKESLEETGQRSIIDRFLVPKKDINTQDIPDAPSSNPGAGDNLSKPESMDAQ